MGLTMVLSASYLYHGVSLVRNKNLSSLTPLSSSLGYYVHEQRTQTLDINRTPKHRQQQENSPVTKRILVCYNSLQSELQQIAPAVSASYGSLLLAGALFAYTRTGSKGSLIGGVVGSSLTAVAYLLMQSPETTQIGYSLAFGSSLLFASVFGIRLAATRKIIPAGPLLGLSIAVSIVFISAYLQDTQPLI